MRRALGVLALALAILALAGCGRNPLKPAASAVRSPHIAQRVDGDPSILPGDDENPEQGGSSGSTSWPGGPRTSPVGPGISRTDIITRTTQVEPVQVAMVEFAGRGYLRRPDLDSLTTTDSTTIVVLAYEKPGYDPTQLLAVIMVSTARLRGIFPALTADGNLTYVNGVRYVSQVAGCLIQVMGDTLALVDTPEDPSLRVVAYPASGLVTSLPPASASNGTEWNSGYDAGPQAPYQQLPGQFDYLKVFDLRYLELVADYIRVANAYLHNIGVATTLSAVIVANSIAITAIGANPVIAGNPVTLGTLRGLVAVEQYWITVWLNTMWMPIPEVNVP